MRSRKRLLLRCERRRLVLWCSGGAELLATMRDKLQSESGKPSAANVLPAIPYRLNSMVPDHKTGC